MRFLVLCLVISVFIGCSSKKEQRKWRKLNTEILNNALKKHYAFMKHKDEKFTYILLKEQLNKKQKFDSVNMAKHFKACLEDSIYNLVFSKNNITYFNKQKNVDIDYTYFIKESETVKKKVVKEELKSDTLPFICDSRCYYMSRVLFTRNYKYAIFSERFLGYNTVYIYVNVKGKYLPFKNSCLFLVN